MKSIFRSFLVALVALIGAATASEAWAAKNKFSIAKVYFEYNASANDLGVHVSLDGEDWTTLTIVNPDGLTLFDVEATGPYQDLGLTELFFEGAEPSLDDVPLGVLLALFPQGQYTLSGETVDEEAIESKAALSHAIPAGPEVSAVVGANHSLVISWDPVTGPPEDFPAKPIKIVAYQVIVGAFQVTVPDTVLSVTVSPEFVATLGSGEHLFEVLAIEAGNNQSITEGSFELP